MPSSRNNQEGKEDGNDPIDSMSYTQRVLTRLEEDSSASALAVQSAVSELRGMIKKLNPKDSAQVEAMIVASGFFTSVPGVLGNDVSGISLGTNTRLLVIKRSGEPGTPQPKHLEKATPEVTKTQSADHKGKGKQKEETRGSNSGSVVNSSEASDKFTRLSLDVHNPSREESSSQPIICDNTEELVYSLLSLALR